MEQKEINEIKEVETQVKVEEVQAQVNPKKEITVNILDYMEKHSRQIDELNKKILELEISKQKEPNKEIKELEL